ncbi:MAG: adenylyl-sulfate kinase, partial [Parasporobacterium sp.]|nr:adenylyl-sulfate kinase [Parasporobacterium sp.]
PIFSELLKELKDIDGTKAVVTISGCSGSGKTTLAAILSFYLNHMGLGTYVLSGDNYPHRIPMDNDAERTRLFEEGGTEALKGYLGTEEELGFCEVSEVIRKFKEGANVISLRRLGREPGSLSYEDVNFENISVLIIEWTHGGSKFLKGADIPVLICSTPAQTLPLRMARARDPEPDSPFMEIVLGIEQQLIMDAAPEAKILISHEGNIIKYEDLAKDPAGNVSPESGEEVSTGLSKEQNSAPEEEKC